MLVRIWGARGSVPSPGADMVRYGGNTSCVQVTLSDGTHLVLDAGTGIRNLPGTLGGPGSHIHILLTHLHLDHIQGLLFFSPLFQADTEITIWGPESPSGTLQDRIARYLSAPLTPVEIRELPCRLDFRACPGAEWEIGSAQIRASGVTHRGPTLGFRVTDGDATLCYLPDHEPALAGPLDNLESDWISGYSLAREADLLLHDCQYTDAEYPAHYGWGHSSLSDALTFAHRSGASRTLLFHHDPEHTDAHLDALGETALERWKQLGGSPRTVELATEDSEIEVPKGGSAPAPPPSAAR